MDGKTVTIKIETVAGNTSGAKKVVSDLEKEVLASQKRVQANSRATDRAILGSQTASTNAAKANIKTQANEFIRNMKQMESEAKKSSGNIQGYLKGAFGGGLIGGAIGSFAGSIATSVMSQFAQIPAFLKTQLDAAVKIAADRQNAFKGLESISLFKGIDANETQAAVKNLRLVKSGIVDIGEASTGLKNLLSSGFSLPESIKLLEAFSDTAAFGKSAALGFGEAIRSATEGIRNGNSILVDNVGLTKNLSAILKDAGFQEKDLSRVKEDLNVRQALYNGLIKEAIPQIGDADKLTRGWTGSTAALTNAQNNLYAAIGDIITRNPALLAAIGSATGGVNNLTEAFARSDSEATKSLNNITTAFAEFTVNLRQQINSEIADFNELVRVFQSGIYLISASFYETLNFGGIFDSQMTEMQRKFQEARRAMGSDSRAADEKNRQIQTGYNNRLTSQLPNNQRGNGITWFDRSAAPKADEKNIIWFNGVGNPGAMAGGGGTTGSTSGGRSRASTRADFAPSPKAKAIIEAAERLGVSPIDLATIISYETGGSFSTTIRGGKGNNYRGLIQFGPEEFQKYNVGKNKSFEAQLQNSVVPFFQDRFRGAGKSTYGANILDLYKTVNGGNPNVSANASDGNGTIASHVRDMVRKHTPQVLARLFGGSESNVRGLDRDIAEAYANSQPTLRTKADALGFVRSMTGGGSRFGAETSSELGIDRVEGRTAAIEANEKLIEQNEAIIELYRQLDDSLFSVNERTEEEVLLRKIKLGQYPGITEGQTKELINNARLIDQAREKIKADGELQNQMEDARREQERLFEDTKRGWEDLLTDLSEGNFKSIWDRMRRQMLDAFIKPASTYLAQLFGGQPAMAGGFGSGGGIGGTPSFGGGSGIGGFIQNLFGGKPQGGQQSNIQIPAGALGTGAGGGSMWGGFGNIKQMGAGLGGMFGGGGKGLGGMLRGMGGGSMMAGIGAAGGAAATMIGSAIGGPWGNVLSLGGMGASIGANFGPWGALIGAGIGAGAGLISMLFNRDDSMKKLKQAAASEFGISVKDKDILKQLKAIGEQYFGKGQAGKNATSTVRTEEGMNILRAYAESSGQSGLKIDRMNFSDENWEGNQYRGRFGGFRANGGPVTAGMSYIVGERRPEVFTPNVSGHISPTVGGDPRMMAVIGQLEETVNFLATKLQAVSPGNMLAMGIQESPYAIAHGQNQAMARDPRGAENLQRNQGIY